MSTPEFIINTYSGPVKFIPISDFVKYLKGEMIGSPVVRVPEWKPLEFRVWTEDELPTVDEWKINDHFLQTVRSNAKTFVTNEFLQNCVSGEVQVSDVVEATLEESTRQEYEHYAHPSLALVIDDNRFALVDPEHFKLFGYNDDYKGAMGRLVALRAKVPVLKVVKQIEGRISLPQFEK